MPVVTPSRASIETVKAVPSGVSLRSAIWRRPSSSQRSSVRQRQIRPRAVRGHEVDRLGRRELGRDRQVALVLAVGARRRRRRTCPGGCPRSPPRSVAKARRLGRSCPSRGEIVTLGGGEPLDVLREHVDLEVDLVAGAERAERRLARACAGRARPRSRRRRARRSSARRRRPRSSPSRRSSGAARRARRPQARAVALRLEPRDAADAVDVALDVVAAERLAGPERRLEVDLGAGLERAERRARERLRDGVERERLAVDRWSTVRQPPSTETESPSAACAVVVGARSAGARRRRSDRRRRRGRARGRSR